MSSRDDFQIRGGGVLGFFPGRGQIFELGASGRGRVGVGSGVQGGSGGRFSGVRGGVLIEDLHLLVYFPGTNFWAEGSPKKIFFRNPTLFPARPSTALDSPLIFTFRGPGDDFRGRGGVRSEIFGVGRFRFCCCLTISILMLFDFDFSGGKRRVFSSANILP